MQVLVPIKQNGSFTEQHRKTAEQLLRTEAFPQFYTDVEFKTLKWDGKVHLIPEELIIRDGFGSSQSTRAEGKNDEYDNLKAYILESGYQLFGKLIYVRPAGGGKFTLIDGRTKDKILNEKKFKNRICVVLDVADSELDELGNRLNASEDNPPAGSIKEIDILTLAEKKLVAEELDVDIDVIRKWIDKLCGKGKFSSKRRSDLACQIFHRHNAYLATNLEPRAWSNSKEVVQWMIMKNYIETDKVVYLPYAASSPIKAFFAAAELSQQKPGKEIRLVVYVSKLNGYNLQKCYLDAVLKFKRYWFQYMNLIGDTYYNGSKSTDFNVKLYGYVPSNIKDVCEDMEKVIVIGKTDQNIKDNYLMNNNLSSFFDTEEFEEDEE